MTVTVFGLGLVTRMTIMATIAKTNKIETIIKAIVFARVEISIFFYFFIF
jgi:hypothetical protein